MGQGRRSKNAIREIVDNICCSRPLSDCSCPEEDDEENNTERGEGEVATASTITGRVTFKKNATASSRNKLNDYNIIKTLGRGGFGYVYLVNKMNNPDKLYALKVVDKNSIKNNTKDMNHAITESNIMEKIKHPYIVSIYDSFSTRRRFCYVMEFLQGGELYTWLERKSRFDVSTATYYLAQIFLALKYLHSMAILYRDLKPENIMLDRYGNAKLIDFGLCQDDMTKREWTRTMCGTTLYMSPEVIQKESYSYPADWWSFGILAYDMMVGNPPFMSDHRVESRNRIINDPLEFPKRNGLTGSAKDLISRLLVKNANFRLKCKEIQGHQFFNKIEFDKIHTLKAPIVPEITSIDDLQHFCEESIAMSESEKVPSSSMETNTDDTALPSAKNVRDSKKDKNTIEPFKNFEYTSQIYRCSY